MRIATAWPKVLKSGIRRGLVASEAAAPFGCGLLQRAGSGHVSSPAAAESSFSTGGERRMDSRTSHTVPCVGGSSEASADAWNRFEGNVSNADSAGTNAPHANGVGGNAASVGGQRMFLHDVVLTWNSMTPANTHHLLPIPHNAHGYSNSESTIGPGSAIKQFSESTISWSQQHRTCNRQQQSSFVRSFSTESEGTPSPVSSPLLSLLPKAATSAGGKGKQSAPDVKTVRAKMTGIKQGVLKMNLVAKLVRGMPVQEATDQLAVSTKRAAKMVSKVVHAAKSNAVQTHGLDGNRLMIAEAFVGKDLFLKRLNPHGKGKSGIKVRQRCQLTVTVREMSQQEIEARQAVKWRSTWKRKLQKLLPQRLLLTKPSAGLTQELA